MRRLLAWMDEFAPGRVPLLLLALTVLSGVAVAVRSATRTEYDLTIWTFTHVSSTEFEKRFDDLRHERPRNIPSRERIHLLNLGRAMTDRLSLGVMTGKELPDLVEVEQSEIGRYFRGPLESVPFVDLTERVHREGWYDKCVAARFAKYSTRGRIFGIPHDLHPVVLVYRPDVLRELGYTAEQLTQWKDWMELGQRVYRAGPKGTTEWRYGLALSTVEAFDFRLMLWQRGGDIFDENDNVIIDSDLAVDTLEFYVSLFRSDPPAVGPRLSGWNEDFAALAAGQIVGIIFPDYMLATMRLEATSLLSGKVRCMPLPAWGPGGRRTSTMGGTMIGIPKDCPNVEAAWALAKYLYFDRESLVQRFRAMSILPPLRTVYDDPVFDEPQPFFGGQRIGRLLIELADEVPPVHGSAYWPEARTLLDAMFADVIAGQTTPRAALERVARDLRESMARDRRIMKRAAARSTR